MIFTALELSERRAGGARVYKIRCGCGRHRWVTAQQFPALVTQSSCRCSCDRLGELGELERQCKECKEWWPLDCFPVARDCAEGRRPVCKACVYEKQGPKKLGRRERMRARVGMRAEKPGLQEP